MLKTIRVTEPLWNEKTKLKSYKSLTQDLKTEVCVIGAGISGLSVAYQLLCKGKQVVILERKKLGEGETGRSTAHLMSALDDRYYNLEKIHGKAKAKLAARSHSEAIDWVERIVKKEKIDCDFKRVPGFLFTPDTDKKELEREYKAAKHTGLEVNFEDEARFGKSLRFENQARFDPRAYTQGLADAIVKLGGKIYEESPVKSIDHKSNTIELANKHKVQAQDIVIATNAQMFSKLSMHFKINPQRSYAVGLKVPKGTIKDVLYWDTEDPYHYVRLQSHDKDFDIMIVGGEDHRVGVTPKEDPFLKLKSWAEKQFKLEETPILYKWSGQILEPVDHLAYIGRNPKNPHSYLVTGDSGNGITHGTIAGFLIGDLILTGKSEYETLYQIDRLPIRAFKNLFANAFASSIGYLKYLIPQWGKAPTAGEGKILQHGFKKVAMYRDENNKLKVCSGICNHMGAILSWNPIEQTWDCPAHGSRFNLDGTVLNGPTAQSLACPLKG